jgi:threonine synthase
LSVSVSLGEGNTPLVESVRLGAALGLKRLFFKLESCNPSGSYKDRFVAAEMNRLWSIGARACVATSSGNTGSSLASYCARYGMTCVIVANDHTPSGKLEQMQAHGARVYLVRGFITSPEITATVYACLSEVSEARKTPLVVSAFRYCPEGMTGVESLSEELARQCPNPVAHVFVPVGGGGLLTAVWRGFKRLSCPKPHIHAVQPRGCSTVVASFMRGDDQIRAIESTTHISGLAVPFDIDASLALASVRESGGTGQAVDDEEVLEMQGLMFTQEGIYCEPAGAAALAGLRRAVEEKVVRPHETAVCLVTGHGFKDPDSVRCAAMKHRFLVMEASQLRDLLLEPH